MKIKINSFTDVTKELPKKTQDVEVLINGNNTCKCMYYHEKSDMFPNGYYHFIKCPKIK